MVDAWALGAITVHGAMVLAMAWHCVGHGHVTRDGGSGSLDHLSIFVCKLHTQLTLVLARSRLTLAIFILLFSNLRPMAVMVDRRCVVGERLSAVAAPRLVTHRLLLVVVNAAAEATMLRLIAAWAHFILAG